MTTKIDSARKMPSRKMIVHCDRCGAKAEVIGVDIGPEVSPEPGENRDGHATESARHRINCPNCGIVFQGIKPQGS
ncbi:MAG TPA: hypothetical protein VGM76_00900 [Lacipirellulaceae bacterium]|jgi:DNA-directed RNA polymerase subunit RPC12/RpoP